MEKIIHNLREKSILHKNQVLQIKQYIDEKHDGESSVRKANIFANAVRQIVEESVSRFEQKHRMQIRSEVLKGAIAKDIFEITGYDVFEVCSLLPLEEDATIATKFVENLTDWVNENQDDIVSVEETQMLASSIIDNAVSSVVDLLEESLLVDKGVIELNKHEEMEFENILDEHITDGRFMDSEGDVVELSTYDIESALRQDIPDGQDISDGTTIDYPNSKEDDAPVELIIEIDIEEEIFDSMDKVFEGEYVEGGSIDDEQWEEIHNEQSKKVNTVKIDGYNLKSSTSIDASIKEKGNDEKASNIRMMLLIPVILVLFMVIIFLIAGAIQVTRRSSDAIYDLTQKEAEYYIVEEVPLNHFDQIYKRENRKNYDLIVLVDNQTLKNRRLL